MQMKHVTRTARSIGGGSVQSILGEENRVGDLIYSIARQRTTREAKMTAPAAPSLSCHLSTLVICRAIHTGSVIVLSYAAVLPARSHGVSSFVNMKAIRRKTITPRIARI